MLPTQLYAFTGLKDAAGGRLEVCVPRFLIANAAAVQVTSPVFRVPVDRVFNLTQIMGNLTAGAAQNALILRIRIVDEANNQLISWISRQAAGVDLDLQERVDLWLGPGMGILAIGDFDAGANPNFTAISVGGVLFPRGNVQLAGLIRE